MLSSFDLGWEAKVFNSTASAILFTKNTPALQTTFSEEFIPVSNKFLYIFGK